jgi:hypothetical protein
MNRSPLLLSLLLIAACRSNQAPSIQSVAVPAVAGTVQSADPALAVDPATNDLLMAWVAGDTTGYNLYFARSRDAGASWSDPVRVTQHAGEIEPHAEASPRLVAKGGVVGVFWPHSIPVAGRRFPASHLQFSRSTDGGRTWSSTITLNDDTAQALAGHTFHGATTIGDSTFLVAWLDSRVGAKASGDSSHHHEGDATIYTATSRDLGRTWAASNTRHWGGACPCCRVSLVSNKDGSVLAGWRGHFPGSVRDPVVARLGAPASTPQRVSVDGWVFQGCPHTGPALTADAGGTPHVAWFTGKEGGAGIFYARGKADGSFGSAVPLITGAALPAAHPAIAANGNQVWVAINLDGRGGRTLTIARIDQDQKVGLFQMPESEGADHPQLIAWQDRAIVAWTEKKGDGSSIKLAKLSEAQ